MTREVVNGVTNFFGPRESEDKFPGVVDNDGYYKEVVVDFAYDDLPTYSSTASSLLTIPAYAHIVSSVLLVKAAAAGGTSYTIGLHQSGGTAIDADGLHTAAQLVTASLTAGASLAGGGALVGANLGAAAGQLVVAATGTFTAGSYRLIVRYINPRTN